MIKPPELKPCPFCGCETVEDWSESTWPRPVMWMYCAECNAKGPRVMMQRNEEAEDWMGRAIAAWNNRIPDPAADLERAWQPIETAPKDGTSIIIGCDYDRLGKSRVTMAWYEQSMWVEAKHWDDDVEDWVFLECAFRATHWMPLPPPPADLAQRVKEDRT